MDKTMSRRDFVKTVGVSVLVVGLGGGLYAAEHEEVFLRPPGMISEAEFLAKCIKCQKCLAVCPPRVIVPVSMSEGSMALMTPTMNFSRGYCDLCMKCAEVCPTQALQPVKPQTVKIGLARINPDVCVAWSWGGCIECSAACPYDAIYLDSHQRPFVDAAKCNGCGRCENICPSGALRAYSDRKGSKGITVVPFKS